MLLESTNGDAIELMIAGYEFPGAVDELGDDWLSIDGRVRACGREWTYRDACPTIDDANRLSGWLRAVAISEGESADRETVDDRIGFTEPDLEFFWLGAQDDEQVFRVDLASAASPPGLRGLLTRQQLGVASSVEIRARAPLLKRAAWEWEWEWEWETELARFPVQRAE